MARGRWVELATDRDEPICGGTIDFMDRFVAAGLELFGKTPPDRVFVHYEWVTDPVGGHNGAVGWWRHGSRVLSINLADEHELAHAIHRQAWPDSKPFMGEGFAVLLNPRRSYVPQRWPADVAIDDVIGVYGVLPADYYPLAWFLVTQIVLDHGWKGFSDLWRATPASTDAKGVRAAYMHLFGEPIDVLLDPIPKDRCPDPCTDRHRFPCTFALCPAAASTWNGELWTAEAPAACEDDPLAVGTFAGRYGAIAWRDHTIDTDDSRLKFSVSGAGAYLMPCELRCGWGPSGIGDYPDGYVDRGPGFPSGRYRVDTARLLSDLPDDSPGAFIAHRIPER